MGLFSSKKKVYVASVVYNMAGDVIDRTDYLKTVVASYSLGAERYKASFTTALSSSLMNGPYMTQRLFHQWSQNYYTEGEVSGSTSAFTNITTNDVQAALDANVSAPSGGYLEVVSFFGDSADFVYWAEQYLIENYPSLVSETWVCEYNEDTNKINIAFGILDPISGTTLSFTPANYDPDKDYLYVTYNEVEVTETVIPGDEENGYQDDYRNHRRAH